LKGGGTICVAGLDTRNNRLGGGRDGRLPLYFSEIAENDDISRRHFWHKFLPINCPNPNQC